MKLPHFFKAISLRKTIRDPRIVVLLAPFIILSPVWATGKALYWGTPSTQFIPWWYTAWQMLKAGDLPLWNPLSGMGAPLIANYQSALLYPPTWIYFLLAELGGLPWMAWGMAPLIAAHLAWAGLGMLLLLRRMELGILAQIMGAMAFSLSGYLVARAHFLSINSAVAWLPWVLLAAYDLVQRANAKSVIKLSLLLALQWLAGHAQIAWYSLILVVIWTAFWAWQKNQWAWLRKVGPMFLAAGLVALALSTIQLFPTIEYLLNSQRAIEVESQAALSYSFWPWRFLGLLSPNFFGSPVTGDYWGFANFWEDAIYIGLLPFLLAIIHLFRKQDDRRQLQLKRLLVFIIALSFLFALGANTPVFPWLFRRVPSFSLFQAPTRFTLWAVFALALLSAFAAQKWRRPSGRGLYWSRLAIAAAAAISLGALGFFILKGEAGSETERSLVRATISIGVLAVGAAVLNLTAPSKDSNGSIKWSWAVALFLSIDLILAGWGLNPGIGLDFYGERKNEFSSLQKTLGEGRIYLSRRDEDFLKFERFFQFESFDIDEPARNVRSALLPNANLLNGIASANNFDPLLPERYVDWVERLEHSDISLRNVMFAQMGVTVVETLAGTDGAGVDFVQVDTLPRLRWLPCARTVPDEQASAEFLNVEDFESTLLVIEMRRDSDGDDCAEIVHDGMVTSLEERPNRILASTSSNRPGWLLLADTWYPGWIARVDDQPVPIFPANGVFRAIQVDEGDHLVEFIYRPASFYYGAVISIFAWPVVIIFWRKFEGESHP